MEKHAVISKCEKYRYQLRRTWDNTLNPIMFIMLNPSTADAYNDDPTIRRCISFAKSWGYGGIIVCNLFAYRATNPKELLSINDPVGVENIEWISLTASRCPAVVCAWGNSYIVDKLLKNLTGYKPLKGLENLHYIALSNDGTPKHPLYLPKELKMQAYENPSPAYGWARLSE